MEKKQKQKQLQNLFLKLRKNGSILRVISAFFLLSIFSFLLSVNHEFYQMFLNQFNSFKQFLNKKVIFCFFNAIILFVAKESGLLASSIEQPVAARFTGQDFAEKLQLSPKKKIAVEENQQLLVTKKIAVKAKEFEEMKPALMEGVGRLEEEEEDDDYDDDDNDDDDDDEVMGEMEELGIDELNKKFEEFIDRVKKGIKMEALQVVMV